MTTFIKPAREIDRVFIHCSASDNPAHDDIDVIKEWHLARHWSDVGYHYFITKDGTLEIGRDIEQTPAAQKGHNKGTIAICVSGLKEELFTVAQFLTLRNLCYDIDDEYVHVTFHEHNEVNSNKTCPVFNLREVLPLNKKGQLL